MTDALHKMQTEEAIERMIAPTGNILEVVKVANCSLYALRWKNGGALPEEHGLNGGKWTSPDKAMADGRAYLRDFWAISNEAKAKGERTMRAAKASKEDAQVEQVQE